MNKIKLLKNINLGIFILSFTFIYFSFTNSSLSSFEIGEKIGEGFIFTYSLILILIYIVTKVSIRKNEDKRKLYFHILFFISVLIVGLFNINNIINYLKDYENIKNIDDAFEKQDFELYEKELNDLSIKSDNTGFLNAILQEKKVIDGIYNKNFDNFIFYYAQELTEENITIAKKATIDTLESLEKSKIFYDNIEKRINQLKIKHSYPEDKTKRFLEGFYSQHSPDLYNKYINLHRDLANSFLDIIDYTEKSLNLGNNIDLSSDETYINMLNSIQKIGNDFNDSVEELSNFYEGTK